MRFLTGLALGAVITTAAPAIGLAFLFGVLVTIAVRIA